ncbi:PAS domain S-box protein, partial [Myxococcota bacterium]|nr:PAS domain S-box protein [Myxococcota bacterium]
MEVLVAANLVNATIALLTGVYHFWFFSMRPQRRDAFWAGIVSFAALVYAASMIVFYLAASSESVYFANKLIYFAVLGISYSLAAFAQALTQKKLRYWDIWAPISALIWISLIFGTNWIATAHYELIALSLSPRLVIQFDGTLLTVVFLVWQILLGIFAVCWLCCKQDKTDKKQNLIFGVAIGLWILAGAWDSLVSLRIIENTPTFFAEYGILAIALALVARTIREHVSFAESYETTLRATEQSFHDLIGKSPELIAIQREGVFVYVNPAGLEFLGYSLEELIGRPFAKLLHPDDLPAAMERVKEMQRTGKALPPVRDRLLHKNGDFLTVETLPIPILFEGAPALVVMARDIDARVKLETKMMQLDRMVALGTLAAGVAHEINNP